MDTISRIFYYGLILLVLLLAVGLIGTQTPFGGYEMRIVQSGSMEPTIPTGSLVVVMQQETYAVDDVVTFTSGQTSEIPTTHRIVDERLQDGQLRYLTQGDANENSDAQLLDPKNIIGRVIFSLPYVGYVLDFARQPLGFVLLIGVPAGFVIFDEGRAIYRELRKKKPTQTEHENDPTS